MEKNIDRKAFKTTALLFAACYFISYITRINYGALITEMVQSQGWSKSSLSYAVTGLFITYGCGQIIMGILGDKFQPKKIITIGLAVTAAMNILVPICNNPAIMCFLWCINGFAQSMMWPPIVKLMTHLFNTDDYKSACVTVSNGGALGSIAVYLFAPVIITYFSWRAVFFICAFIAIIFNIIWQFKCINIQINSTSKENKSVKQESNVKIFSFVMILIFLAIILQGTLRDGIQTWMPSYIGETYNLGSKVSILTGVLLPLFGMLCFKISLLIYRKLLKNPLACAGAIFAIGFVSALILMTVTGKNALMSVIACAVLNGSMHGVNLILLTMLPAYFANSGKVSTVSGVLNSCTYIGSAISTYGFAKISEVSGSWSSTVLLWTIIAFLGAAICFAVAKQWRKNYME